MAASVRHRLGDAQRPKRNLAIYLSHASLCRDDWAEIDLRDMYMKGVDLRDADPRGAVFHLVDLRGAKYDADQREHFRRCRAILEERDEA